MAYVVNAPNADIYVIDVSFQALKDKSERDFLNQLPTSFVLPPEAVDRLRAAAATIIFDSPDLRAVLQGARAHVVTPGGGRSRPNELARAMNARDPRGRPAATHRRAADHGAGAAEHSFSRDPLPVCGRAAW